MNRILIVEDEPDIEELLLAYLKDAGYEVESACDGVAALDLFRRKHWDLVLLDLMLPKIDGYGVCEVIRRESSVPIVMLTALDSEQSQLRGFDLQIDDYVTKPFSMPVLLRKIGAILRRAGGVLERSLLTYRDICLDLDAYQATLDDQPLELTAREFELLRELLQNQDVYKRQRWSMGHCASRWSGWWRMCRKTLWAQSLTKSASVRVSFCL